MKARIFFTSCEDTDAIDAKGTTPMLELLRSGGSNMFPTLEPDWVDENLTLNQILARVGAVGGLGSSPLITMGIHSDQKESQKNIVYLTQTGYFLPSRQLFLGQRNSSILRLYERLYVDIMTSLGANFTTALRDAADLVDFEIRVANATSPPELRRDAEKLYNKMSIEELSKRYPQFDWLTYLKRQFSPEGIRLTARDKVVVNALDYYDKIFPIVDNTPRRTLMNYCMWRIVYPLVGLLSKPFRDTKRQFSQALNGAARSPERWKECVTITDSKFPHASGRLYVDHHFSHHAKAKVEDMIRNLVSSFKDMLHETDWMSEETKRAALEKADAIIYKIGYPDEIMNDTVLNEKIGNITITEDGYFHNHLQIFLHSRRKTLRKLREPVNREEWPVSAATVNAFYNRQTNEILFPAGILHRPFFSDQYLDALNYGGIGFVIGHEITHGFDDSGRSFDKDGNLHMWWKEEDLDRFKKRTDCMVKQYSNYTEPKLGRKVNGRLTLGEDIADNGGLKEAYKAYRKLVSKRGMEEPRLPVLDYTPDQLFFISAAQAWCGNMRDKLRLIYLQTDYHSPMRFRVIGPMQNNEDFTRAFNCPSGSYMNPERKCRVW
ncbi:neprilysin-4-like [Babylonia areolata]|uniref:neprilysin-4-like n=1 Tax=Babylonia areolata TaxID=304850 RepID=UPI003FD60315